MAWQSDEIKDSFLKHPYFNGYFLDPTNNVLYINKGVYGIGKYFLNLYPTVKIYKYVSELEILSYSYDSQKLIEDFKSGISSHDLTPHKNSSLVSDADLPHLSLDSTDTHLASSFSKDLEYIPEKGSLFSISLNSFVFRPATIGSIVYNGLRKVDLIIDALNSSSPSDELATEDTLMAIPKFDNIFIRNTGDILRSDGKPYSRTKVAIKFKSKIPFVSYINFHDLPLPSTNENSTSDISQNSQNSQPLPQNILKQHPNEPTLFLTTNNDIYSSRSNKLLKPSKSNSIRFYSSISNSYTSKNKNSLIEEFNPSPQLQNTPNPLSPHIHDNYLPINTEKSITITLGKDVFFRFNSDPYFLYEYTTASIISIKSRRNLIRDRIPPPIISPHSTLLRHPIERELFIDEFANIFSLRLRDYIPVSSKNTIKYYSSINHSYIHIPYDDLVNQFLSNP